MHLRRIFSNHGVGLCFGTSYEFLLACSALAYTCYWFCCFHLFDLEHNKSLHRTLLRFDLSSLSSFLLLHFWLSVLSSAPSSRLAIIGASHSAPLLGKNRLRRQVGWELKISGRISLTCIWYWCSSVQLNFMQIQLKISKAAPTLRTFLEFLMNSERGA